MVHGRGLRGAYTWHPDRIILIERGRMLVRSIIVSKLVRCGAVVWCGGVMVRCGAVWGWPQADTLKQFKHLALGTRGWAHGFDLGLQQRNDLTAGWARQAGGAGG